MDRRTWMYLSTGVVAAAAGAGAAWWRAVNRTAPVAEQTPTELLWTLAFPRLGGGEVDFARLRGRPLLLNFWATWCPPCVREMPLLDRFARETPGWQLVGLAADNLAEVERFVRATPVAFPVALAGFEGIQLARQLGDTAGGLPYTVVFDASGQAVQRHIGETTAAHLAAWREQIGPGAAAG
jgi:thiol-disulfide isomerase/thioredoxin